MPNARPSVSMPPRPLPDASPAPLPDPLLANFADALRPRVRGDLRTDAMTRALYATDASMYQVKPAAVLLPKTSADVQAALEASARFGVPVLARGGGSSLAGQCVGPGLVVDFSRYMDRILAIDPEQKTARVQPGVVLDDLNQAAQEHGLMVGPDPASSSRATLGGMVANNATGTHSILYGNTIHHVRSVKGVLAGGTPVAFGARSAEEWRAAYRCEGREGGLYREIGALLAEGKEIIARDTPRHWRRNSGYRLEHLLPEEDFQERRPGIDGDPYFQPAGTGRNLAKVVCGSEGTLMVLTEIEIALVERPARTALGLVHFETRQAALRAVRQVLDTGPSAVELLDGVAIERCRQTPGYAQKLTFIEEQPTGGDPGGLLITEYSANDEAVLEGKLRALQDTMASTGPGYAVVCRTNPADIADVWTVRKEGMGLLMGVKSEYKPWAFIEDASVPVEHLPDYIDALSALIEETDTRAVYYAHASGGCLHVRPFINTKDAADVQKMKEIAHGSMKAVARFGGVVSSEHGDGRARSWLNEEFLGPDLSRLNRRLKRIFDPDALLNPGSGPDAAPMDRDLRMGPAYRTRLPETELDFSADGGFAGAVELCNGNGACRKTGSGTMCPSFMATREEEHSTRGRANALRMAISGQLPGESVEAAFTSERMKDVMDLCIQCKGCKTECPSGVDMGKLKKEWLAKVRAEEGLPLRDRLFSSLPTLSRRLAGRLLTRPANAMNRLGPVRWLMDRFLDISRERALPAFAVQTFRQWFTEHAEYENAGWVWRGPRQNPTAQHKATPTGDADRVVLFPDTFTSFHAPEVGQAATRVLDALGMRPVLPDATICCGRTLLSKGRLGRAQQQALQTVDVLLPFAQRGVPVVGLEPSCTSALTDDLRALLPGDPQAEAVAEAVTSFEELLSQRAASRRLEASVWGGTEKDHDPKQVLLHAHCHQKALGGETHARTALSLPPGHHTEALDAGCCGMAGAFGYEKEHVAVSRQMAELKLAPAVRQAAPDTVIAAPGFSCRSQIADTTGRTALHPAEVLAEALGDT